MPRETIRRGRAAVACCLMLDGRAARVQGHFSLSFNKYSLSLGPAPRSVWGAVSADRDLELRQLRTFVAVARHRSFTRAADDLHIAQQAVSQQIKALERSLGVALLRRSSRRVDLTAEGAVFLADCRRVLTAADRATRRVKAAARARLEPCACATPSRPFGTPCRGCSRSLHSVIRNSESSPVRFS